MGINLRDIPQFDASRYGRKEAEKLVPDCFIPIRGGEISPEQATYLAVLAGTDERIGKIFRIQALKDFSCGYESDKKVAAGETGGVMSAASFIGHDGSWADASSSVLDASVTDGSWLRSGSVVFGGRISKSELINSKVHHCVLDGIRNSCLVDSFVKDSCSVKDSSVIGSRLEDRVHLDNCDIQYSRISLAVIADSTINNYEVLGNKTEALPQKIFGKRLGVDGAGENLFKRQYSRQIQTTTFVNYPSWGRGR